MNNAPWNEQELGDIGLGWSDFQRQHPDRSYDAWRQKRDAIKKNRLPTPKKRPIILDDEADLEKLSRADLVEKAIEWQDALHRAYQQKRKQGVKIATNEPVAVAFFSDWHIGNQGTDLRAIKRDCEIVAAHPRLYCSIGGDPVDNFILEGMGSAARTQSLQVQVQWAFFAEMIEKVLPSLLYVSSGNHDAWTRKVAGIDGVPAALAGMKYVYTEESGYFYLAVGKQEYTIWRKHKPVRHKSAKNMTHFLKEQLKLLPVPFDIGISEHLHTMDTERFEWPEGSKIDRIALCLGSYKVEDDYSKECGFDGTTYGVPCVIFYPDRRRMIPVNSIEEALEFLDGPSVRVA